jgi:hypothetical protein
LNSFEFLGYPRCSHLLNLKINETGASILILTAGSYVHFEDKVISAYGGFNIFLQFRSSPGVDEIESTRAGSIFVSNGLWPTHNLFIPNLK